MFGGLFENLVCARYFLRLRGMIRFESKRGIKFSEPSPENRVVAADLSCSIQYLQRFFFIAGCERNRAEAFIGVDVLRIERDGAIGVIDRLIRPAEIFCVDEGELQQWLGRRRICLD